MAKHPDPKMGAEERRIAEALERSILHGLACEWEYAVWGLPEPHRLRLKKPLFRIEDLKTRLGCWSDARGEIVLSRDLVLNHPWDSVREVLHHEMAHQLACRVLGAAGETPHGPRFQEACRLLRANPRASGGYETLHERLARQGLHEEDRIVLRIRKLMALAQSHNRHEAEAAMEKAHALMRKHHASELAQKTRREFESVFVGAPALRHFGDAYELAHLLQEFYFVQGIWVPAYVVEKGRMGRVLEISGTSRHVRVAAYVHEFVRRFIDREWERYSREHPRVPGTRRKTDFASGVVRGFRSRLMRREAEPEAPAASRALIPLRDTQLEGYMSSRYPTVRAVRGRAVRRNVRVLEEGIRTGECLVIAEGVSEREGDRGKRLPQSDR